TFDKALAAGSITVNAADAVTVNQNLSSSNVTTSGTGNSAVTGAISLTGACAVSVAGALPTGNASADDATGASSTLATSGAISVRSEERRVGKERSTRGSASLYNENEAGDKATSGNNKNSGESLGTRTGTPPMLELGEATAR